MKFSIVVPVYNVEKYIDKCLKSIKNQSYKNFEVIIVNDGSKENEEKIINKYLSDKRFSYYKKKNGGLSDARNYGVKYITGDYLIFIDSDDYIEKDLLKQIDKNLKDNKVDILKYAVRVVEEDGTLIRESHNNCFSNVSKEDAIKNILKDEFIEPAWMYAYKVSFWKENKFLYPIGKIHEDYALTPIILSRAETLMSIDYSGYNYVQRENSIMSDVNYEKIIKRVNDFKDNFLNHRKEIKNDSICNKLLLGFSAEAMIYKTRELKDKEQKEMINFIKKEKVIDQIYGNTFKKKLQKIYLHLFLKRRIDKLNREFYQ